MAHSIKARCLIAVLLVTVAGCSGGGDGKVKKPDGSSAQRFTEPLKKCDMVPAKVIRDLKLKAKPDPFAAAKLSTCGWHHARSSGEPGVGLSVLSQIDPPAAVLSRQNAPLNQPGTEWRPVQGLGDEAGVQRVTQFAGGLTPQTVRLMVRKANAVLVIAATNPRAGAFAGYGPARHDLQERAVLDVARSALTRLSEPVRELPQAPAYQQGEKKTVRNVCRSLKAGDAIVNAPEYGKCTKAGWIVEVMTVPPGRATGETATQMAATAFRGQSAVRAKLTDEETEQLTGVGDEARLWRGTRVTGGKPRVVQLVARQANVLVRVTRDVKSAKGYAPMKQDAIKVAERVLA